MNPSLSGIKGFEPHQLQAIMMQVIVQEKACNFASLRQLALYVLQFWGVVRFIEVVSPDFSKNPNPVSVGTSQIPTYSSRKRAADADDLNTSSKFNATFNPKASVIKDTRYTS